jgi:sugar lactone lactonase YvrE
MEIEDRLTTLEKRLRYHRITVGILALFIMLLVGTRVGANSGEITCTELRMVNSEGATLVVLGATEAGGFIGTFSPEEKALVVLGATTDGSGRVWTHSPEGKELVVLGSTTDGSGGFIGTYSPEGKQLVVLGATTGGSGGVMTFSPEGKELVSLGTTSSGSGGVWTTTKSGRSKRLD